MPTATFAVAIALVLASPARQSSTAAPAQLSVSADSGVSIRGRVADPSGLPVRYVRIHVHHLNGTIVARSESPTGDDGTFHVRVRPGDYDVCAVPFVSAALRRTHGRFEGEQPLETCRPVDATSLASTGPADLEITLRYGPVFSIAGEIVDSSGGHIAARALQVTTKDGSSVATADIRQEGNGFTIRGVPPGEYQLSARLVTGVGTTTEKGVAVVRVGAADVDGVVVKTMPPVSVVGRVEFAEGVPSLRPVVNVNTVGERIRPPGPYENIAHVGADWTFRLDALIGPQMFQAFGAMRPWAVKAIRYRGEDIYGKSVQLSGTDNPDDLVIVLTNRSASVTAKLRGVAGPPTDAAVFLIPLDPATGAPLENAAVRPIGADGALGLPVVRPGDYLIAAVTADDAAAPLASVAPRVARVAQRISLAPGEHRVIELDLVRPARAR